MALSLMVDNIHDAIFGSFTKTNAIMRQFSTSPTLPDAAIWLLLLATADMPEMLGPLLFGRAIPTRGAAGELVEAFRLRRIVPRRRVSYLELRVEMSEMLLDHAGELEVRLAAALSRMTAVESRTPLVTHDANSYLEALEYVTAATELEAEIDSETIVGSNEHSLEDFGEDEDEDTDTIIAPLLQEPLASATVNHPAVDPIPEYAEASTQVDQVIKVDVAIQATPPAVPPKPRHLSTASHPVTSSVSGPRILARPARALPIPPDMPTVSKVDKGKGRAVAARPTRALPQLPTEASVSKAPNPRVREVPKSETRGEASTSASIAAAATKLRKVGYPKPAEAPVKKSKLALELEAELKRMRPKMAGSEASSVAEPNWPAL